MTKPLTQQQIAGQIGALIRWGNATAEARRVQGRRGQEGLRDRFRREIRESGETDPAEIERRMQYKLSAHYIRMRMARRRSGGAAA